MSKKFQKWELSIKNRTKKYQRKGEILLFPLLSFCYTIYQRVFYLKKAIRSILHRAPLGESEDWSVIIWISKK